MKKDILELQGNFLRFEFFIIIMKYSRKNGCCEQVQFVPGLRWDKVSPNCFNFPLDEDCKRRFKRFLSQFTCRGSDCLMNVFSLNSGKVNFVNCRKSGTGLWQIRYLKFWLEAQIKEKPIPYSSLSNSVGARGIHEDSLMSVQYWNCLIEYLISSNKRFFQEFSIYLKLKLESK